MSRLYFSTICLDPPWNEQGGGKIKRGADRHYNLLKTKEMPEIIFDSGVFRLTEDAHMYMWVTNSFLQDGLWLMGQLGFVYKTNICWRKRRLATEKELKKLIEMYNQEPFVALARLHELQDVSQAGIGQYFRGSHELLLFGVRGRGFAQRTERRDIRSVIHAFRTPKHSQKPEESYELIEARSSGPYLEMFARSGRPGWTAWGNQAPEED